MTFNSMSDSNMSQLPKPACIAPDQIREGDLLAFLDGDAPAQVADHLDRCPACRTDLAQLADTSAFLGGALFRMACPPTEDLLAYQTNLLGRGDTAQIDLHVQGCPYCQAELAELAAVPLPAPAPTRLADRLRHAGRRLIDAVRVTPAAQPVLQLRGDEQTSQIYQAGDFQIILAKVPPMVAEDIWQIEGQLMAESDAAQAHLEEPDALRAVLRPTGAGDEAAESVAEDVVDDLGFFLLEGLTSGTYVLEITTPDAVLRIEDFTIP